MNHSSQDHRMLGTVSQYNRQTERKTIVCVGRL